VLIGQKGLFAAQNIPADTILGVYSGVYTYTPEDMQKVNDQHGSSYVTHYIFGFNEQTQPRVSSFKTGNRLTLINDATDYSGTDEENTALLLKRQNVRALYAKSTNNPDREFNRDLKKYDLVIYATYRSIKAGEQLYITYGKNYWTNLHKRKAMFDTVIQQRGGVPADNTQINQGLQHLRNAITQAQNLQNATPAENIQNGLQQLENTVQHQHGSQCASGCGHHHTSAVPVEIPIETLSNISGEVFDCGL
jgi:hypothetical protein